MRLLPHEGTVGNICSTEKGRRGLRHEGSLTRQFKGVEDPVRAGEEIEEGQTGGSRSSRTIQVGLGDVGTSKIAPGPPGCVHIGRDTAPHMTRLQQSGNG